MKLTFKINDIRKKLSVTDKRYKQAIKTSLVSVIAQGLQMLTALISVPLVLNAVGSERYGLWMTLSSILLFITFSDFGMGIGMQNAISYAIAKDNKLEVRKSFTTTLAFGLILFVGICVFTYLVLPSINLFDAFKYNDLSIRSEILPTLQAVTWVVSLGILAGLIQRAFDAFQEGYIPKIITVISRIFSLAGLVIAVKTNQSLGVIILIVSGLPNLFLLFGVFFLYKKHPFLVFKFRDLDAHTFSKIFRTGIVGLGAAIAIFLVSSITPFLISSTFGLAESAKYLVLSRFLNLILTLCSMLFMSFWPAVADAFSKGDMDWLNNLYKKCMGITLRAGIPLFLLLLFGSKWAILLWTGNVEVVPSITLIVICISFTFLSLWNMITCVFLNGMSVFKGQATYGILIAACSILFAYFLRFDLGVNGIVLVITIGMLIRCIMLHFELMKNLKFRKLAIII